jgi:hypothetical protein
MTQQKMLEIHAIVVDSFIKEKIKEYREQVERGEAPRSWLNGYIDGAIEYENLLLENRSKHIIERKNNMTTEERASEKRYLTTKEFKRKVTDLGFVVEETPLIGDICIYEFEVNGTMQNLLARIWTEKIFASTTLMYNFNLLKDDLKEKLFNLVNDYASTPLDERVKEQKFYLQFAFSKINNDENYLNYYPFSDSYGMGNRIQTLGSKTEFAQKDIDDIKKKFGVTLHELAKIPVEEDEER